MSNSKRFLPRLRRYMDEGDRRQHRLGTLLYALSGVMCGIGLAIMMPAAMALQSGNPQWGLAFWGWAAALAAVAIVGSTVLRHQAQLCGGAGLHAQYAGGHREQGVAFAARLVQGGQRRKAFAHGHAGDDLDRAGRCALCRPAHQKRRRGSRVLRRCVALELADRSHADAFHPGPLPSPARLAGMRRKRQRAGGFCRAGHRREDS